LYIPWHRDRDGFVGPIERDGHAEVSVTERSNFEFVFMFFKRLDKVICVGLCTETYSKIIDDEAEHDVARGVPE
jgi:hypothetical protein